MGTGAQAGGPLPPETPGELTGETGPVDPALAKTWDGISATLPTSDQNTRRNQYAAYYRKANQRYLEEVGRAARDWQED